MKNLNVCVVFDVSTSMCFNWNDAIDSLNGVLLNLYEKRKKEPLITTDIFFTQFSNRVNPTLNISHVGGPREVTKYLVCGGGTALLDAIGQSINHLVVRKGEKLLIVFTDGQENSSVSFNKQKIQKLINDCEKSSDWTFAFNVPPGDNSILAYGVSKENVRYWDSNKKSSIKETGIVNTSAIDNYYTKFSQADTKKPFSSRKFYTDLSNVTPNQVRTNLTNLAKEYKKLVVSKLYNSMEIRHFIETFNIPYKKGRAFYELTKPELVQENKQILVMQKGKEAIWGGIDARRILGIPEGRVKIIPGNHSRYRIFVQSNSVNRKLVGETTVLLKV